MKRNFTSLTSKNIHLLLWVGFFLLTIGHLSAQNVCTTMPEPVSYTQVGTPTNKKVTEFTTIRGVRVERVLEAGTRGIDNIQYATDDNTPDETYCGKDRKTTFKGGNKKYPFMDSNKVKKITYKFSKPVNDIEVFLAAFGYNGAREWWKQNTPHKDVVKFTVNNGGEINLALRSSCTAGAVTISGDVVSSEDKKTTDAKVGISSSTPFTELTLEFLEPSGQTGGYGFFVEICLASIVTPIESSSCTPPTIGDPFNSFPNQTVSVAGMTLTRKADSGVNKSVSFTGSHCGSSITYPSKDPLLIGNKKIVYEFSIPVKSAEIFLLAFGDNTQVNSFDKAKFEVNGGGAISLSKSYDCNPIVSTINNNVVESVSNRKLTTDVGIKVASSKPFSRITITDMGSTGYGYLVALCPTSIVKATDDDIFTIDKTLTAQSVCEDAMTGVPPSYGAQATSKFNGGSFKYELQAKKSGSSSWLTIATQDNKTSGTNINFVEANLGTLPYDQANIRVKYTYKNPSEFSEEIVRYSNVATLTVSEAKVTKLTATPLSVTQGITTNVAYRIEGTSNATVTYQVNGGTPQTVGLNNSGVATVTLPTSQATTFKITRVQKGACNITQNKQVQVTATPNNAVCSTLPSPQFPSGTTEKMMGGVKVTIDRTNASVGSSYTPDASCKVSYPQGYTLINNGNQVKYIFSQPVNNVELWLALMSHSTQVGRDTAKITTNCGTAPILTLLSDCKGNAVINNNTIYAEGEKSTDVAVKITADKPFTELTITDDNSTAGGYLVELCPASIKKQGVGQTDPVTITTQLTATTTACVGFTTTLTTQATLASPFSGSLNYQWQKSTNNGTTWSDISGQSGSAASGANVTYSFTPTTSDNNALYRVAYTYNHAGSFCGTMSLTTNATKLVANTVSSVIAINTPAYTDVAVCASATGTTTITAKATLNTGMGGTGVTYQLQYRPTDTANWVDHATQKYTLVTGGAEKILTIENVASNTGYYRVKYTSDASVCGGGESYSNIFKFTALTVTDVLTINPTTYPDKVVCTDATFTINAQATVSTGTIANDGSGNKFSYELQYKANSSANWVNYALPNGGATQTYSNNTKVGATRVFTINTANVANGGKFRVRYAVDLVGLCDDISAYSGEFTVTKGSVLNNITEFYATPATLNETGATNVVYTIKGVPGTQLLHKFNNGTATAASIPPGGVLTVTHNGQTATATLAITQVANGTCTLTTNYLVEVGKAGGACTSFPSPQFAKTATAAAQIGGLTVNRTITGTPQFFDAYTYDSGQMCQSTILAGYPIMKGGQATIKYTFSKPVTSVQVWLSGFGGNPSVANADSVTFAVNCGGTVAVNAVGCGTDAGKLTVAGGKVSHQANVYTQAKVVVTSDKPFTELTLTDPDNSSAGGYVVELCPISVVSVGTMSVTAQPTPKTICAGDDSKLEAKAILTGVPASYSISYEWQQSDDATTWIKAVAPVAPAPTGSVLNNGIHTSTLTLKNVPVSYNGKYFRVVFKYTSCTTTVVTATSTTVRLTVTTAATPTVSSTTTLCPTANSNIVSFDNYVTPAVGTTLRWYATPTATASTTVAPTINTNVTTRTTATAYVRAINNNGCTSGLVTVTLTVNDTTPPTFNAPSALNIVCNSTTATTAINTWLGTATATDACGAIATITNNYNAPADFCTVPGGVITVTFVAKDTFGNVTTKTSTIKLAATPLTVASDTFTVGNGVTTQTAGNILTNDNLGGNIPTAGPTGSVTITVVTPATPIGGGKTPTLDVNTGIVTVPAGTKSGTYTITYKECESLNPSSNCQTQTVVISVGSASLTVVPETLTVTPSTSTQTTPSIFDNDSIGGVTTPTAGPGGNVTMTVHNPSGSKVPTMDPNTGKVTVPGNTPAGNYTITYNYCEVLNPTNCTGTRTVVVTVGAPELVVPSKVYPLAPGTTSTETVIDTATLGGNPVSSTAVTIAVVTPATSLGGTPTPTLNTTTGKITVPTGTKSGTYNIVYRVCEVLNPSNCKTATATVVVGEVPVITPDNLPIVPSTPTSTTTRTIGNILTNDTVGTQSATAGTGGNVTITITSPITPNTPVIDPTTGNVQIPPTTPPGVYTITYDVCTTATPVACTSGTLTVTVSQPSPIIRPENLTVTQTGTSTTPSILNNDDIVKPDGTTASATGSNVTITNVVVTPGAAPGAPTPTLNPDGTITVPGTLPPGVYTITYDVCTTATPSTCVSGTTVLTVSPTATATPTAGDNAYDVPTSGTATVVGTILSNDTVDGVASATATNVTVSVTTAPTGTGVPTIGSNGSVTVPANAIPGVYTYTYHICSVATPTACSTEATVTVTVRQPVPVLPNNNMVYTDTTTTTAGNITTGGTVGTQSVTTGPTGNVTITVVTPATPQVPGGTVPTLNPDGTVTVPTGTASGTYTITYQVCTTATPTSCVTGVVTITVSPTTVTPTVLPVAVDDRASTAVNTPVNIAVLPNDTLNGATTPNVVTSPANGTVMVNSDNTIEYRPHTGFTGTDTFVYEICNSAGCSSATVTVEVVNKIIPYSGMSVNGDGKNDHFHIGGIENYPNNVVRIYNRWGVKVFEVNGYDNVTRVFRGISDARATVEAADKLPQGTYYYVIEYYDQNNKKQSEVGWLYLKK